MVFVTASAADVTITLPPAAHCARDMVMVKKVLGTYKARIVPQGTDKIDGGSLLELTEVTATFTLYSDGTTWHVA